MNEQVRMGLEVYLDPQISEDLWMTQGKHEKALWNCLVSLFQTF